MTDMTQDTRKAVRELLAKIGRDHEWVQTGENPPRHRLEPTQVALDAIEALRLLSADEASQQDREAVVWATGFMLGLRQQGMDQWEAWERVKETAEKWEPTYYAVLKNMERLS